MKRVRSKEISDFDQLYLFYYPKLVRFSREYVFSLEDAENLVQDVFMVLWEQRKEIDVEHISSYLFRLVKNKSVDFLRHKIMSTEKKQVIRDSQLKEYEHHLHAAEQFNEGFLREEDMESIINNAIQSLPERCRDIFLLSRFEGMTHQQIADKFDISSNTVNNHITLAMKKLRVALKDFSF